MIEQLTETALANLISGRLQGVDLFIGNFTDNFIGNCLVLEFYAKGRRFWLVLNCGSDSRSQRRNEKRLTLLEEKPRLESRPQIKPIVLFLRSHFTGHTLVDVDVSSEASVKLQFSSDEFIEIQNEQIVACAESKSVSLKFTSSKPNQTAKMTKMSGHEPTLQKRLLKLERARGKVEEELTKKNDEVWSRAGQWLLMEQTKGRDRSQSLKDAPQEFSACLDLRQSLSWNINRCFEKAKQLRAKIAGTLKRRDEIDRQIVQIKSAIARGESEQEGRDEIGDKIGDKKVAKAHAVANSPEQAPSANLLARAESRGRTFAIEKFQFFVGKSAADNLRLLRAARPWHLWLHLKDYPGSHGIMQINKGERVSESALHEAAHCLLKSQFGDKASRHFGDKFDMLVVECRHVRPIKGDRLGRVNYANARTFVHHFLRADKMVDDDG